LLEGIDSCNGKFECHLRKKNLVLDEKTNDVYCVKFVEAWAEILTPPGADNDEKSKKYPLLIHT